jgi:diaminohydroxyphosphoribosylaminopyrimidine deaminase/5-amino-6-(5-phosphoribosylamino)uracil reductase
MSEFSAAESAFMERALCLARQGQYTAHPNPMVGCVLVKDGNVVGEGWHALAGEPHAEINALQAAGENARGATAFVTLEPCAHHGKTPPCSESLIKAGVSEIVVARKDPNPRVDGKGLQALSDAGIPVRCGLMKSEVDSLLAGFLSRIERGRPYVRLKIACSIDGRIAMADGQSQWITGDEARADVQRLRARSGAIMTGIGTVLADDPSLTVRDASLNTHGTQPTRVVVDSKLRMPASAKMLKLPGTTVIACGDEHKGPDLVDAGAVLIRIAAKNGRLDLSAVLNQLALLHVNDLLVEAGPGLAGGLIEQKLVDELVIYQAPHIMGSETLGMFTTPGWTELADRQALQIVETCLVGDDTRITAILAE